MAIAEEKVLSANGKVAASPWITVAFEPFTRAPSFAANAWSYSRLVTRAARCLNSSVAAPGPAPSSSTCSPSSEPCRIQGRSCRRVTYRQNDDPQNHVSNRFIDSSEDFEGSQLYRECADLVKHCTDLAERRCELIGVIRGWVFELLEESVNRRAHLRRVRWLCVLAVCDIQRIQRHRCLFRRAFVRQRNIFRVIGNALQHPQRNRLAILHLCQSFGNPLRQRRRPPALRSHSIAIGIQPAHLFGHAKQLAVQFLRVRRVDL